MIISILIFIITIYIIYKYYYNNKFNIKTLSIDDKEDETMLKCDINHIYQNGNCKNRPGNDCLTSSDCSNNHVCFMNTCTLKPSDWNECLKTSCTDGLICIDNHLMLLKKKKFVMLSNWWKFNNCIDICDGPFESSVYILTNDSIYLSFIEESSNIHRLCSSKFENNMFIRIFIFKNGLHVLDKNGYIYRGNSNKQIINNINSEWEWEKIDFIYGRDISEEIIIDITSCNDGSIIFTLSDNKRLRYDSNGLICTNNTLSIDNSSKWTEELFFSSSDPTILTWTSKQSISNLPSIIKYGKDSNSYIIIENNILYFYSIDVSSSCNKLLFSIPRIKDAVIDPNNKYTVIIITKSNIIKKISFNISDNNLNEIIIPGSGNYLKSTSDNIWLLTDTKCFRV